MFAAQYNEREMVTPEFYDSGQTLNVESQIINYARLKNFKIDFNTVC